MYNLLSVHLFIVFCIKHKFVVSFSLSIKNINPISMMSLNGLGSVPRVLRILYTMLYKDGLPLKALAIVTKRRNDVLFADLRGNKKIIKIVVCSFRGATS